MSLNNTLQSNRYEIALPATDIEPLRSDERDRRHRRILACQHKGRPLLGRALPHKVPGPRAPAHTLNYELDAASLFAHELAQPLTAIVNYVEACRRTLESCRAAVPDRAFECIDKAAQESARAGKLIGRLRSLVKHGRPERRPTSIVELVEQACAVLHETIDSRAVELELEFDPDLPDPPVDAAQVRLVMTNLVRNAVEAVETSKRRQVKVKVASASPGFVQVSVIDSGPGLGPDTADRLFQPLASRKPGGLGIGLSICHSVITAHGGRIWADRVRSVGAAFHFTLPFGEAIDDGTDDLHR